MSQSRNIALKQVDTERSYEVPEPKPTLSVKIKSIHDAKDDVNLWDFMALGSSDLRKWEKPLRAALWLESRERTAVIGRVRNSSKSKSAMSASAFMAEMRQQALSGKKPGAGCGNKSISMCLLPLDIDPSTDAYFVPQTLRTHILYQKPYGRIFVPQTLRTHICTTNRKGKSTCFFLVKSCGPVVVKSGAHIIWIKLVHET